MQYRLIFLILILSLTGCDRTVVSTNQSRSDNQKTGMLTVNYEPSSEFSNSFKSGRYFWDYRHEAERLHEAGEYEKAIQVMEKGYDVAAGRNLSAVALRQMAQSYEAMHNYEIAANFYEALSKTTMNSDRAVEARAKASQMQDLFKAHGYEDMKNPPKLDQVAVNNKSNDQSNKQI